MQRVIVAVIVVLYVHSDPQGVIGAKNKLRISKSLLLQEQWIR